MKAIVFIATAWGRKYGGINAFNADLCRSMPAVLPNSCIVHCFVIEAEARDKEAATLHNIMLHQIDSHGKNEQKQAREIMDIMQLFPDQDVQWWIGHDVITGGVAQICRDESKVGSLAVFHHMSYNSYSTHKNTGNKVYEQINAQRALLQSADVVLAVGPKLTKSAESLLIEGGTESSVVEITPGLSDYEPSHQHEPFKAIVVGRLGSQDDIIKQYRLAVAAFGHAMKTYPNALSTDSSIELFGVPEDEAAQTQEDLKQLAFKHANRLVNVIAIPFVEKPEMLLGHLRSSWVCLMLSLHEGFGLAGWEAISAEVPLILSKNSGIYQHIDHIIGGAGTGCLSCVDIKGNIGDENFSESDLKAVADSIVAIALRFENVRSDAHRLKEILMAEGCDWQTAAMKVCEACEIQSIFIAGVEPGEYVKKILSSSGAFDEHVSQRGIHFEQIFDRLKADPHAHDRLVLFGGVSTALRNADAVTQYAVWLIQNRTAHLFVCYETGTSAAVRAETLDETLLATEANGLPSDALMRMQEKVKQVEKLQSNLRSLLGQEVTERIHFIPLSKPLTNYTMICGEELYIAPVLHARSTETESIRLPCRPTPYRTQFLDYMLYHLEYCEDKDAVAFLTGEIAKVKLDNKRL